MPVAKSFHYLFPTVVAFALSSAAWAQSAAPAPTAEKPPLAEQLVDSLNGVFGKHPGARAVHAKGIVTTGEFIPSGDAKSVTKASFLQNKSEAVPVTVRFSNFAGLPDIPDNHPGLASPRGLAIKFQLGDGSTSDIISHSVNGFPSSTAESFRDLLIALGTSGPDATKPTPLDKFLETHPAAKEFLTSPKPAPVSYATLPFFGVNAFKFTNAAGAAVYGRYRFVPMAGAQYLTDEQRDKSSPNYLKDEMAKRLAAGPVEFKLLLQVANAGDPIEDPSLTWADDRKLVDLGLIRLTKLVENSDEAQKELLFLPDSVPDGIEPADPMILERSGAYGVSFGRRHQ